VLFEVVGVAAVDGPRGADVDKEPVPAVLKEVADNDFFGENGILPPFGQNARSPGKGIDPFGFADDGFCHCRRRRIRFDLGSLLLFPVPLFDGGGIGLPDIPLSRRGRPGAAGASQQQSQADDRSEGFLVRDFREHKTPYRAGS